uniref:receptor protein-tyrosine kinase n=1 Tax=Leptobrachium leishanense TaxID=445787 RepID=A0A8C5QLE1_9ANUR
MTRTLPISAQNKHIFLVAGLLILSIGGGLGLCNNITITSQDSLCKYKDNASQSASQDCTVDPAPPFASFIGSHNVTLGWKSANVSDIAYIIQWKYVHITNDWQYTQVVTEPPYTVNNLQPYTEYWFRVIWIFCWLEFYSPSSPAYRTLPYGGPSGSPIIENLISTSPESIEVSWHPPLFPNGPIIGYNLKLSTDKGKTSHYSVTGKQSFQFYATIPRTTYRIYITAVNGQAEGPAADVTITTGDSSVLDKHQWLFLSRNDTLHKRESLEDILFESQCLAIEYRITGVSVNIHTNQVYFSEQNHIWVKGTTDMTDISDFRIFYTGLGSITSISVDWLYNSMYFVMNNQIHICNLWNCTTIQTIPLQPALSLKKIVADPYNGYLFLLVDEGIQRINLPHTFSEDDMIILIINNSIIQDFAVNVNSKRLFFTGSARQGNFSIVSCFLDGSDVQNTRQIVANDILEIRSFVYYNERLIFTDGNRVFCEEYHNTNYFYNELLVLCDFSELGSTGFANIMLYGESTQPIPIPNQPQDVMMLFGTKSVAIVWKQPKTSIGSSPTAWQEWLYTVNIKEEDSVQQIAWNISTTYITVTELTSSTKYKVTVQASSPAGQSSWTPLVEGTTLYLDEEEPYFIAAGDDGLWRQPLDAFGPGNLISDKFKFIADLEWNNNTVFWSNESGHVFKWNMQDPDNTSPSLIAEIRRAGAISFDWLGQCIYWSDKVQSMIFRKPMDTPDFETVKTAKYLVKDLAVDSVNAFIYWSSSYTVESSKLNGQKHSIIQNLTLFANAQVVALALDFKDQLLYWLGKDGLNINLYHTALQEDGSHDRPQITEFAFWSSSEILQHALMFYSDRLFWINGHKYITVQEVNQSTCTPFSQPAEFTAFTLVLNSSKPLLGNFSYAPNVIPGVVPVSSIQSHGDFTNFTITWNDSSHVEYGTVFFCVKSKLLQEMFGIGNDLCLTPEGFTDHFFIVSGLDPYTEFDFSIIPYTYWRTGNTTSLILRAPEGVPSPPLNLRIYFLHTNSQFNKENISVELRWDDPRMPNGALTNFTISYRVTNATFSINSFDTWTTLNLTASTRSLHLHNLSLGLFIQFWVQAYTAVGPGLFSDTKEVNTSDVRAVPAIFSISSTKVALVDLDRKVATWILSVEEELKHIAYTTCDRKMYYILSDLLFCRDIENLSTVLLLQDERLSASKCMAVDWISRHLYISINSQQNGLQLHSIDLEKKKMTLKVITVFPLSMNSSLEAITAYALLSRLYWIECWDTIRRISYYNIKNGTIHHVLGYENKTSKTSSCNCFMESSDIGNTLALDSTDEDEPSLYFISNAGELWTSDLEGCHCEKVISLHQLSERAVITSLAVDDYSIYWSITDQENTTIYQTSKYDKIPNVLQTSHEHIKVMAYSTGLQPFPDKKCLLLAPLITQPLILNATNTSISLQVPLAVTEASCPFVTSPTTTYWVKYWRVDNNNASAANYSSYIITSVTLEFQDQNIIIQGLQPYSYYEFEVTVGNFYSLLLSKQPEGTVITGKTAYGVPEAVDIMLITVLSDSVLNITWNDPLRPNGPLESIRYQITSNLQSPIPFIPWRKNEFPGGQLAWSFTGLQGGTRYQFKVLAFHPDENWVSESAPVYDTTFNVPHVPENIVPGNITFTLQWRSPEEAISNVYFEIKEVKERDWILPMSTSCTYDSLYFCILTGVVPNTIYHVRAVVIFWTEALSASDPTDFKTSAGVPGKPGTPQSLPTDKNTIQWVTSEDHGSNLTYNILEYIQMPPDGRQMLRLWQVAFNGSCLDICLWKSTNMEGPFQFRAAAANMLGVGNYSETSESIILTKESNTTNEVIVILAVIFSVLLVVILAVTFVMYRKSKVREKRNTEITVAVEDKELSELRGVSKTVGLANACYAVRSLPTQTEMQSLPQFPREKLTLCVFLGSGAFGEVYEGNTEDILGPGSGTTKVAVKTLKSDATDHEKTEFLKEAHLMSQFDHPNILKLLGVCLFNEPQFIILELMDGGDLLEYLRGARGNTSFQRPLLSPLDLIDISLNICKGCAYLEKMHFVHRSFGVLLWEIFSLGQQPYPGFSNLEVLHHVRAGQRMEPPANCSDDLWDLILKCWAQDAVKRPAFFNLKKQLEDLQSWSLRCSHVKQRGENLEGVFNPAFEDDNVGSKAAEDIDSLTLTETRNSEGLNYLMVAT